MTNQMGDNLVDKLNVCFKLICAAVDTPGQPDPTSENQSKSGVQRCAQCFEDAFLLSLPK